ncbi:hypothetical protein MJO29_009468 [Puccinia striiformis f. sp. tritici]|nr:hypothetical protein MJO29_009468 [Puccinia striiformis f. sp. tritici]
MGAHQATAASAGFSQPRTSVTIPGELPESQVYLAKSVKSGHGFDLNLYARHNKSNLREWYPISIEAASIERSIPQSLREERELLQKKLGGFRANLAGKEGDYSSPYNVKVIIAHLTTSYKANPARKPSPINFISLVPYESTCGPSNKRNFKHASVHSFQAVDIYTELGGNYIASKIHNSFNVADTCVKRVSLHQALPRVPKRQAT